MKNKIFTALNICVVGLILLSCDKASISINNNEIPPPTTSNLVTSIEGEVVDEGHLENWRILGTFEGAFMTWDLDSAYDYHVYYKEKTETNYHKLDDMLVRVSGSNMRADILGLKGKANYNLKIVPVLNNQELANVATATFYTLAYDRSGYAHFNYNEGVGAYNDDGTLKENALVIYVTNENKDNISHDNPWLQDYLFNIPGNDWNNKEALGIGWYLNNSQYSKASRDSFGNVVADKSSNTYSPDGDNLGFARVNKDHPLVIRFIGTVTSPEGLTAYNSILEGGNVGDNGHMARMKNYKNITIEGVGDDAIIDGWGLHFIATDSSIGGYNFEARNLTFKNYPEDALGMEGVQEGNTITAPVRNCFIHHNTFLPGYCENPAESDKKEGDGSCDFKRGFGYTLAYNYFEDCHKTNLIGSSDSSLQYDITMHHNLWYQCESRIPLVRQANVHFYNNYIYGDITKGAALSYVSSIRANAYLFSEANYYDGMKQVYEERSGGVAKAFGNTYVSCFNTPSGVVEVVNRDELVESNCAYKEKDYRNFDTNRELFYYDEVNKKSDCYITDASVAREVCITISGSAYRYLKNSTQLSISNTNFIEELPEKSVNINGFTKANFPTSKGDSVIDNIVYKNITGVSASTIKFRGQGITFSITNDALVNIVFSTKTDFGYGNGFLVDNDGYVYLNKTGSVLLKKGTYSLLSYKRDGETIVDSLTFEYMNEEDILKEYLDSAIKAIDSLNNPLAFTKENRVLLEDAKYAISLLTESQLLLVNLAKYEKCYNSFTANGVLYVENLIGEIGIVTIDSKSKIDEALEAYNDLLSFDDSLSVTNYASLLEAEKRYHDLSLLEDIKTLYEQLDYTSLLDLDLFVSKYEVLDLSLKEELSIDLDKVYLPYVILLIDSIGQVTIEDSNTITKALNSYEMLSSLAKLEVHNYNLLLEAKETLDKIIGEVISCNFKDKVPSNSFFNVSKKGGIAGYKTGLNVTYSNTTYDTGLKMETGTTITFDVKRDVTLTIVADVAKRIVVDGTKYQLDANGVLFLTLEAGSHTIAKGDSMNVVYLELN